MALNNVRTEASVMAINASGTKILLDGGDPAETKEIRGLLGRIDGQTTNPSLVAKNPTLKERIAAGHKLTVAEQNEEYKKIVQSISPLVGTAGVSIEVFADMNTTGEEMLAQGIEMYTWIPNANIKYSCTPGGLLAPRDVCAAENEGQYDVVLHTRTGCSRVCSH
jgi:transaldolase